MSSAFEGLTDNDLDGFRLDPKHKVSATHPKAKDIFVEQQFELLSSVTEARRYRLYKRHHPSLPGVFSVGLAVCLGADWLTICRYNGDFHPHRNRLEKNRLVNVCHIHHATQRYIQAGLHPDGFAVQTDRYSTIDGAFRCMLIDCRIAGVLPTGDADPLSENLFP